MPLRAILAGPQCYLDTGINRETGDRNKRSTTGQSAAPSPAAERHGEEEAQRRYRGIDRRRPNCAPMLIELKSPEVFYAGCIGRAAQKRGVGSYVANVVLLGICPESAKLQILQHPLA